MRWVQPGPNKILPGRCPGGIVCRTYDRSRHPRLLSEVLLHPDSDFGAVAERQAAELKGVTEIVWVIYDGDTGRRWGPADYVAATGIPGGRLR